MRREPGAAAGTSATGMRGCHAAALLGTTSASFRALLAMVCLVACAFLAAFLAYIGAHLADCTGELATSRHISGSEATNLGAVHIERDAAGHHLDILLLQTGCGTVVAGYGAVVTGIDAGLELIVRHSLLRKSKEKEIGCY